MDFHFIRPLWLLALLPAIVIAVILWRQRESGRVWKRAIAPHLLPHLLVRDTGSRRGLRPHVLLSVILFVAILALAGPTWKRKPSPFVEDTAALVIALEVTPTMLAEDIQPSRLVRATQKIADLLEGRKGAPTALISYAGSAHLVMPLTKDPVVIASFARELHPDLMPAEGDAPSKAVGLAKQLLDSSGLGGSVLLITDGVPPGEQERIAEMHAAGAPKVHVFGVAAGPETAPPAGSPPAPALDLDNLKAAAKAGKGDLIIVSADDSDVSRVARSVETNFTAATSPDGEGASWIDSGYWLLPLLAVGCLMWFRPGWAIQHASLFLVAVLFGTGTTVRAGEEGGDAAPKSSIWKTDDQQAQEYFDTGEYAKAAQLFTDPMRQGVAWYRAKEFKEAAAAFGRSATTEAFYNRGNALLMMGKYAEAIASYDEALESRPDWKAAKTNRDLAVGRSKMFERPSDVTAKEHLTKDDDPDGFVFDLDKNDKNAAEDTIVGAGKEMDDQQMRAIWLRQVETKPADFLRAKFAFQHARDQAQKGGGK